MNIAKRKAVSNSKITQASSQLKYINSQLKKKLTIAKSQLRIKNSKVRSIVGSNVNPTQRGKPVEFLQARRQNYLNSQYNKRKNVLLSITKQNRKIYDRINSQKSNYSSRVLNKTYDSVSSVSSRISNRSSRSRASQSNINKSSRKRSIKNSRYQSDTKGVPVVQPLVKAQNINKIDSQQIINFNKVFNNKNNMNSCQKIRKKTCDQNVMSSIRQYPLTSNLINSKSTHNCNLITNRPIFQAQNQTPNKYNFFQFTPERNLKVQQMHKNHVSSIGLPKVIDKTPPRFTTLEKIIQDIGHKYRF